MAATFPTMFMRPFLRSVARLPATTGAGPSRGRMKGVWCCLFISYHGILESMGDNSYPRHRNDRFWARQGIDEDREVQPAVIGKARAAAAQLALGRPADYPEPPPGDDDAEELPVIAASWFKHRTGHFARTGGSKRLAAGLRVVPR